MPSVASDPERYWGRCVVIDGVMQGLYLYESVDGVYLQPRDRLNPSSSGFRLGVDGHSGRYSEDYRHVSIIGRVQDCETVRNAVHASNSLDIVFVAGYCHSFNGAYVWVEDLKRRRGAPFERQTGSYERNDYGDIEPAPESWPHRATVDALARQFLDALRKRNTERLVGLHFRDVGDNWPDDEAALLEFLLARDSPFASVRDAVVPPEQITLVERDRLEPDNDADDYTAIVCFCREESCTGRWPIATFDADNVSTRPYVCTVVEPYVVSGKSREVPHFSTELGTGGLAEPRRRR